MSSRESFVVRGFVYCFVFLLFVSLVLAIVFNSPPTPIDGVVNRTDHFVVSANITESNLQNLTYSFNNTDFDFYSEDLIVMFNFDNVSALDESDDRAIDLSVYNHSNTGTSQINSSGYSGAARDFNATTDYLEVSDESDFDFVNELTIAGWINTRTPATGNQYVFDKQNRYSLAVHNSGKLGFYYSTAAAWTLGTTVLQSDTWYHVAVTFNNNSGDDREVKLFLNGMHEGARSGTSALATDNNEARVGCYSNGGGSCSDRWGFDGMIDELMVWNRSLSGEEINVTYRSILKQFDTDKWELTVNNTNLTDGTYDYNVTACDSSTCTNTSTQSYTVDTINPLLTWVTPLVDNSSTTEVGWFLVNVSAEDTTLHLMNVTVSNETGSYLQSVVFDNINNSGSTTQNITFNVTLSDVVEGETKIFNVTFTAMDSHTDSPLRGLGHRKRFINWIDFYNESKGLDTAFIALLRDKKRVSYDDSVINDYTSTKVGEKYKVDLNVTIPDDKTIIEFYLTAQQHVKIVRGSDFYGHVVWGSYHTDFEDARTVEVNADRFGTDYTYWNGTAKVTEFRDNATIETKLLMKQVTPYSVRFELTPKRGHFVGGDVVYVDPVTEANNVVTEIATINYTVSADSNLPSVTVVHPVNDTGHSSGVIDVNYTAEDDVEIENCILTNATGDNVTLATCQNVTATLSDGFYNITLFANDTAGNLNHSVETYFTIDTTLPSLIVDFPANNTVYGLARIDYNVTINDNLFLDNCIYTNVTGDNVTESSCDDVLDVPISTGEYNITWWANDTANNLNFSVQTHFEIDNEKPFVTINDPANNTGFNGSGVEVNFTSGDGETFVDQCFYTNATGSNVSLSGCANFTIEGLVDGDYLLTLWVNDSVNNLNYSTELSYTIDGTPPSVNVSVPLNDSAFPELNISLNFTSNADDTCFFLLNTAVLETISDCDNTTFIATNVNGELNNLTVEVNDTSGNANNTFIQFYAFNETPFLTSRGDVAGSTTATVNVTVSHKANFSIHYGINESFGSLFNFTRYQLGHEVNLTGLSSGTQYFYNITVCNRASLCNQTGIFNFTTTSVSPAAGGGGGGKGLGIGDRYYLQVISADTLIVVNEQAVIVVEMRELSSNNTVLASNIIGELHYLSGVSDAVVVKPSVVNDTYVFSFTSSEAGDYLLIVFADRFGDEIQVSSEVTFMNRLLYFFSKWWRKVKTAFGVYDDSLFAVAFFLLLIVGLYYVNKRNKKRRVRPLFLLMVLFLLSSNLVIADVVHQPTTFVDDITTIFTTEKCELLFVHETGMEEHSEARFIHKKVFDNAGEYLIKSDCGNSLIIVERKGFFRNFKEWIVNKWVTMWGRLL